MKALRLLSAALVSLLLAAAPAHAGTIAITPATEGLVLHSGDVLAGTGGPDTQIIVEDGATVTLRGVCITNITADEEHLWGGVTCRGDATIVLEGDNYLRGGHPYVPGLFIVPGKTLVIRGDGTLDARSNGYGAGIGGGRSAGMVCGDIVIEGGTIVAIGGDGAAGIGSGPLSACGNIVVSGGSVTATGGDAAAGIGSGVQGTNGTITVTGGIVTAAGGPYGAGIGSGYQAVCGDIAVSGGTVVATGGQYAAGVGSGIDGTCGDITLSGGTVAAAGGQSAPGVGSGATQTGSSVTATCGDIALEEGVIRVTADGGGRAAVGAGLNGACGAVTVGGVATTVVDTHYVYAPAVVTIATAADWEAFASRVNRGVDSYDGRTVTLAADIAVSTPVGTNQAFRGTFDGGGHMLAVDIEGTGTWTAPFVYIDGATISNLTVTGTVASGGNHGAGLVGACGPSRPNAIRDCTVAVDVVADGTGYAGGIVGQGGDSTLALEDCVFSGSVRGFSAFAGGLLGWGNTMTLAIDDCLVTGTFAPAGSGKFHPIACKFANRTVAATVSGAYWINAIVPTATGDNLVAGAAGAPVSATLVPGAWAQPVAAADGNTYYAWTPAPAGRLLAHLAFDDAGNAGTNLLRAAVGLDAIVRATPATPVEGPGEIVAVSDAGILSGLAEGDGAVAIPLGQHLAVPIPAPLLPAAGRPYTVVMKIRVPDNTGWRSLLNMPASNDSDAMVYLQQTTRNIYLKQFDKSSGAGIAASNGNVAADRWTTLAFAFGENATDIYRDGTPVLHATGALAGSYADCAASGGYVLVGADDSGDDNLFYLSDFRIYEGAVAVTGILPGSGTPADPYLISSADDWSVFAANVRGGVGSAACYRLAADISVAETVGTQDHPFGGTFNGGGLALTANLSGTDYYLAPFSSIGGATISNLVVSGTVAGNMHCSGLVGLVAGGTNTIENCKIDAAIVSSGSHFGGVVGHGYTADTTLRGCVFSGSLSGGTYVATFNAWSDGGATTRVVDCLDASASTQPIGRGNDAALVSNAYYATTKNFSNGERLWSAGNRGKRTFSVTEGEGVTIDFGAPVATYAASGIAAYATGIARGGVFYAGEGETISLGLSATPPAGEALDGFVASAGTLAPDGGAWSLAMPAEDVVVTASFRPIWAGSGTADAPYRIATVADWNALADVLDGGADTAGKHFLLATNLSVTTMLGDGSASPFKGVFDGGGRTLTVALTGTERYVAPFSAISGATISNLVVAGTVSGGMHCAGLVGSAAGGTNTIADCEVAAAISSSGSHFGGIVGHGLSAETTLRGCTFSGTLAGGEHVATLFGWGDSPTVTVVDCFDASASPHPIGRGGDNVSVANTYFLAQKTYEGNSLWSSANRGRQGYSVTAAEGVAIGFGAPVATYGTGGIAAYATGLARGDVRYAPEGAAVPLGLSATPPEGLFLFGYSASAGKLSRSGDDWTLAMAASDTVVSAVFREPWSGSGTAADPYRIADAWTWSWLADLVAGGEDTAGKHYLLLSNIVTTAMVGTTEHPFAGVFDGGGHTLTADLAGTDSFIAPFSVVSGATIGNLVVAGTVRGNTHCAGLVGFAAGTNRIEACRVSAEVRSSTAYLGGVLGHGGSSSTTLAGCVFDGNMDDGTEAAVFWGWSDDGATASLVDCLDVSGCSSPVGRGEGDVRVRNVCFAVMEKSSGGSRCWASESLGTGACRVQEGLGVASIFGEATAAYAGIGLSVFANGFEFDGCLYAARGTTVALLPTDTLPGIDTYFASNRGTLSEEDGIWYFSVPEDANAATIWRVRLFHDGEVVTGTIGADWMVAIADGATVTLRDAVADGSASELEWPGILCLGDAVLVLEGENVATAFAEMQAGVQAGPEGTTLVIRGPGSLVATGRNRGAGIGAGPETCGDIVISDGTVSARGGTGSAGIGGSQWGCGDITVNGGMIVAFGGNTGSGIGAGRDSADCGNITINGGNVTAVGGDSSAGIGTGRGTRCGRIAIAGGIVSATGGRFSAGIGTGRGGKSSEIVLSKSAIRVTATKGADAPYSVGLGADYNESNLSVRGPIVIGGAESGDIETSPYVYCGLGGVELHGIVDLASLCADFEAQDGDVLRGALAGPWRITIADGATVGFESVTVTNAASDASTPWAGITCLGDAFVFLAGSNVVCGLHEGHPGIFVPSGGTLVLDGAGTLAASAHAGGAGIGGGSAAAPSGDVSIAGGTIVATGGAGADGIGADADGTCGHVSVGGGIGFLVAVAGAGGDCIGDAAATLADGLFDKTEDGVRTIKHFTDLSTLENDIYVRNGDLLVGKLQGPYRIRIAAGATVTLRDVDISGLGDGFNAPGILCEMSATVILEGSNIVSVTGAGQPGMSVPDDYTLAIRGEGSLTAGGGAGAAGIGGGKEERSGFVSIVGGTVTAIGGARAAGIGAGSEGNCDGVSILGGTVTATGGENGAGIGSGYKCRCNGVLILGGTVTAVGGARSAGIGAADSGICDFVRIEGGSVVATGGGDGAGIGAGYDASCDDISILGGTVTAYGGSCGAGIGVSRNYSDCTCIGIAGGTVIATGGEGGAGIGVGPVGYADKIEVSGGAVTAIGGADAAGIGTGADGHAYEIEISGGTVAATGGSGGAGVGGANRSECGDITLSGGAVTATGGPCAPGIGSGDNGECGDLSFGNDLLFVVATAGTGANPVDSSSSQGTFGKITIGDELVDDNGSPVRTIMRRNAYPDYLRDADDSVKKNYLSWAASYGFDKTGTNLVAFLLDADPAAAVPAGAEPLKVADFALANGVLRFEIASDWVAFRDPDPPPPGVVRVTSLLGNGILVLRSAPSIPCDDADWEESRLWIVDWLPDGHVVAEFEPKRGASALPARFFRPAISTVAPDDDSGGQVH